MYGHDTVQIFNEQLLLAVGLDMHLCNDLLRPSPALSRIFDIISGCGGQKIYTFLQLTAI